MEESFYAFCDFVKKGSATCTDKTLKKICTDCNIYCKGMDQNRVDIQFRKHLGAGRRDVDFEGFCAFLEGELAEAYMEARHIDHDAAVKDLQSKVAGGQPGAHGATSVSKDSATARLTDRRGYTGSHKERFDMETGKGKGKEGRENLPDKKAQQGYVGNYKNMDKYDQLHKK
ncbi:Tubulin polymerization-promoting protein family member 3 [Taenia solium]|eukprot:TsM_000054700 transcript=TsM_000054700 gene=TsM_000054700